MLLAAQETCAKFRPCQKCPPYLGRYPGPEGHQIRPDQMKRLFVLVMLPEMGGRGRGEGVRAAPSKTISIKSSEIERDRSLAPNYNEDK